MKLFLAGLFLVSLSICAHAQDFDKGRAAYERNNYEAALFELQPLAERGDARSQAILGRMYYFGEGVPVNHARSAFWRYRAAMQGDTEAQVDLGLMYQKGWGVPLDNVAAHLWFDLAAELGNEPAEVNRDAVAEEMTAAQISDARRKARKWLRAH